MAYALVIHGGAGARPGSDYTKQKQHMQQLIKTGQDMLVGGKSALDVVVWVVEALEESGLYTILVSSPITTNNTIWQCDNIR